MKFRKPNLLVIYAIRKKGTTDEFVTRATHNKMLYEVSKNWKPGMGHRWDVYSYKDFWQEVTGPRYFFPAIEGVHPGEYEIVELEYQIANINVKPNP